MKTFVTINIKDEDKKKFVYESLVFQNLRKKKVSNFEFFKFLVNFFEFTTKNVPDSELLNLIVEVEKDGN